MNNKRRKILKDIKRKIELYDPEEETYKQFFLNVGTEVSVIQSEEEDAFDSMPENLQGSMRGINSEEAIDYLSEAHDIIDDIREIDPFDEDIVIDKMFDVTDLIEDAIYC